MKDKLLKIKILFTRYIFFPVAFKEWKEEIWDTDLDDPICCSGNMCCCGGETNRENFNRIR
jgi:hypothetical protein